MPKPSLATNVDILDERERCAAIAETVANRPEYYCARTGAWDVAIKTAEFIRAGLAVEDLPEFDPEA
jgi:hypothetical protein